MKKPWFQPYKNGLPIVPVTWQGKAVIAWAVFIVILSVYIDDGKSVKNTIFNAFPFIFSTLVIVLAIMQVTSKR